MSQSEGNPVGYKIVSAKSTEEALAKSGLRVGDLVRVVDLRVSSAGPSKYSVMPLISTEAVGHLTQTTEGEDASDKTKLGQAQA